MEAGWAARQLHQRPDDRRCQDGQVGFPLRAGLRCQDDLQRRAGPQRRDDCQWLRAIGKPRRHPLPCQGNCRGPWNSGAATASRPMRFPILSRAWMAVAMAEFRCPAVPVESRRQAWKATSRDASLRPAAKAARHHYRVSKVSAKDGKHWSHHPDARWMEAVRHCLRQSSRFRRRVWSRASSAHGHHPSRACFQMATGRAAKCCLHPRDGNNSRRSTVLSSSLQLTALNSCLHLRVLNSFLRQKASNNFHLPKVWSHRLRDASSCHRHRLLYHHRHHHVRRRAPIPPCSRRRQPSPPLRPVLWSMASAWLHSPFARITSMRSTLG